MWTCDGTEYVLGDADHDGYLAIRAAMLTVDPTISVGAVGVDDADGWSGWGNEVIGTAGDALDFYVVHLYGFDSSPSPDDAVRAAEPWSALLGTVAAGLPDHVPLAITEYNLVSVIDNDTDQAMTRVMNGLFIADSIGELAHGGATIANQWNLANGRGASGTDYGLIDVDDASPYPQFEAFAAWSRMGETLFSPITVERRLRVYPSRHADGRWTILVINLTGDQIATSLTSPGEGEARGEQRSVWADDPTATRFETMAPVTLDADAGAYALELAPWSITTIDLPAA